MNAQQRKQNMKRQKQFHALLVKLLEELADVIESHKESPEECAKAIRGMIADHKEAQDETR